MKDKFPCPLNLPPGNTLRGKVRFFVKSWADLQMASVLQKLKPWLSMLNGNVIEVGSGLQPYRHYIPKNCIYKSLDFDKSEDRFGYKAYDTVYYSGERFPFDDNSFNNLFHNEVLEHIFEKESFLSECWRILEPDGELFFTVPFQARYHYIPFDYWRFTPASLEQLLNKAGFVDVKVTTRGNDITVAAYKNISLYYRWLLYSGLTGKVLSLLICPIALVSLLVGQLSLRMNVGSKDDCLGYAIVSRKKIKD